MNKDMNKDIAGDTRKDMNREYQKETIIRISRLISIFGKQRYDKGYQKGLGG